LNDSNSVDFIVLSSPKKQIIGETEAKEITSNYFIIPYSEVLNLNMRYISVESGIESGESRLNN